jgi:type IV secretory pathway VirB10-like protein
LAAVGAVLCLVVGGIIVSVFRGNGSKEPASIARENPERPKAPRFLERQPGDDAERFAADIAAKQKEQELRREQLRELLASRTPTAPPAGSPLFLGSSQGASLSASPETESELAAVPAASGDGGPPPGVYRPYPVRTGRPSAFAAAPAAEVKSQSALARALEAPIVLGAAKDQPAEAGAPGPRARFPLSPPSPPDIKSLLSQIRSSTSGESAQTPAGGAKREEAVDFGRVVWAPAILLTALSSESPGPVEAWIEGDAKDPQGRVVLPQGSRVFGSYDTGIALGQKRLVVRWTSIELPNGATVALEGARSAGRDGAGGLRGHVDARIWGAFGRALFLSAIGAVAQLGQPQESAAFGAAASNRQVAAASVANELSRAAADVVRQATDIKPVIRVPAGTSFFVFVPADFDAR